MKVWDLGKIAGEVHEIKKQDNQILNILTAQTVGIYIYNIHSSTILFIFVYRTADF